MVVRADRDATWRALLASLASRRRDVPWLVGVHLLGAQPAAADGAPLDVLGAELPGFEVCEVEPPRLLAVRGWHHFAAYLVRYRLDAEGPGRTRVTIESEAMFPGRAGALYGKLVVGTGFHVMAVKGLLHGLRRRAERT